MNVQERPTIFNKTLQLINGDIHLTNGDFAIVKEKNNLQQALKVMIETPFGTDIFNVNYGFDLMNSISQPQSVRLIKELIRLNIVKSLSLDDRVREIREVVFDDEPRFFELHPQEDSEEGRRARKASRRWQAVVVLETLQEGEVIFRLEGVGL